MTWCKHMNKAWNQVYMLIVPESPAFFSYSANSFTLVHQKVNLSGNCKHPLLSPTFFLPVRLLNAPPSWFVWTLRASSGQGRSLATSGGRFMLWPWAYLRASHHWAAPTDPSLLGSVILSCSGKDFQTLGTSDNSSYRKMPSGAFWGIIWQAGNL